MHKDFIPAFELVLKRAANSGMQLQGHPREVCAVAAKAIRTFLKVPADAEDKYPIHYILRTEVQGTFGYISTYRDVLEDDPTFMRVYVLWSYCMTSEPDWKSLLRLVEGHYDGELRRGIIPSIFIEATEDHERRIEYLKRTKKTP